MEFLQNGDEFSPYETTNLTNIKVRKRIAFERFKQARKDVELILNEERGERWRPEFESVSELKSLIQDFVGCHSELQKFGNILGLVRSLRKKKFDPIFWKEKRKSFLKNRT